MAHEVISPPPHTHTQSIPAFASVTVSLSVSMSASATLLPPTSRQRLCNTDCHHCTAAARPVCPILAGQLQTSGPALRSDNHSFYVQALETSWAPPAPTHQTPGNWSIFCSLAVHGLTRPFQRGVLPRLRKLQDNCWLRRRKGRGSSSNFGVKTRQSYSRDSMALPAGKAAAQQGQNIHSFCIHASTREKRAESLRCMAGNVNRRIPPTYLG
jgi:hypothetical protein